MSKEPETEPAVARDEGKRFCEERNVQDTGKRPLEEVCLLLSLLVLHPD